MSEPALLISLAALVLIVWTLVVILAAALARAAALGDRQAATAWEYELDELDLELEGP